MKLYIGVKAFIVHDEKILIIREAAYDEGVNTGKWDIPGGRIKPEEALIDGLRREVMEEVGICVDPGVVLGALETFPVIKGEQCHIVRIFYRCVPHTTEVILGEEHDAYEWHDPKKQTGREFVSGIEDVFVSALQ